MTEFIPLLLLSFFASFLLFFVLPAGVYFAFIEWRTAKVPSEGADLKPVSNASTHREPAVSHTPYTLLKADEPTVYLPPPPFVRSARRDEPTLYLGMPSPGARADEPTALHPIPSASLESTLQLAAHPPVDPSEIDLPQNYPSAQDLPTREPPERASDPLLDDTLLATEVGVSIVARRLPSITQEIEPLRDILAMARQTGDPSRIGRVELELATTLLQFGRDADARRVLDESPVSGSVSEVDVFIRMRLQAKLCARSGDLNASERWWRDAHALGSTFESRSDLSLALAGLAENALLRGKIGLAQERVAQAEEMLDNTSPIDAHAEVSTQGIELARALGAWDIAHERASRFRELSTRRADLEMMAASRALLACVMADDRRPEAMSLAYKAIDIALQVGRSADGALRRAVRVICDLGGDLPESIADAEAPSPDPIDDGESAWLALQARSWARSDRKRARMCAQQALERSNARSPLAAFRIHIDIARALRDADDAANTRVAIERAISDLAGLDMPLPGLVRELEQMWAEPQQADTLLRGGRGP